MDINDINLILKELREELKKQEEELAEYQSLDLETDAEWITEGWCEALTFAIKKIEGKLFLTDKKAI